MVKNQRNSCCHMGCPPMIGDLHFHRGYSLRLQESKPLKNNGIISHHPRPTRGRTMKFTRRHDLTPHTRVEMVRLAWLHQGIYGKMTQIAQDYHISRTFLYQLIWAANLQLETLFSDQQSHVQVSQPLLEPLILLLRLEGKCSIPSLSSILKYFQYQPNSVGYLSAEVLQNQLL